MVLNDPEHSIQVRFCWLESAVFGQLCSDSVLSQSYAASPLTISFEINSRGPGGNLEPFLRAFEQTHGHRRSEEGKLRDDDRVGLDTFTAMGDFFNPEGKSVACVAVGRKAVECALTLTLNR